MKQFVFLFTFFLGTLVSISSFALLPSGSVHEGDYFSTGKVIEVSGVVKGDVFVSGGKIFIDGRVEGDLIALGGTIEIVGEVTGNARLAGADVKIYGRVGRNITVLGGSVQTTAFAEISGNAQFLANSIDLGGNFLGNVYLMGSEGRISANIAKDVKAYVGYLRVTSKARIQGKLNYNKSSEVEIDKGATISGEIEEEVSKFFRPNWQKTFVISSRILGILMNFLFSFVLGAMILKFFPVRLNRSLLVLQETPWKALVTGILIAILIPICCLLLFITVLGIPFAIVLVTLAILTFYAAKILPIIWVSNNLFGRMHLKKNSLMVFFLGLVVFFLLKQVPILGFLISISFTLLGLGTAVLSRVHSGKGKVLS